MAASYLRRGMDAPATFSLYVRSLPPERGFLVARASTPRSRSWRRRLRGGRPRVPVLDRLRPDGAGAFRALAVRRRRLGGARGHGRIRGRADPGGHRADRRRAARRELPAERDHAAHHDGVEGGAVRRGRGGRPRLVDFALRRTHGIDAAMAVTRASAIAGFAATSNVEGARRMGCAPPARWRTPTSSPSATSGRPSARSPRISRTRTTFLVDTYDTLGGVRTAIEVIRERGLDDTLGDPDRQRRSGRPVARRAQRCWTRPGSPHVRIFASGGLDEHEVASPGAGRCADRRVRGRHADGRVRRRALSRDGLQARPVRGPRGREALAGQAARCRARSRSSGARRATCWGCARRTSPARRRS